MFTWLSGCSSPYSPLGDQTAPARRWRSPSVGVHVGGGAGAALDDIDDELVVVPPASISSQAAMALGLAVIEMSELLVGTRRRRILTRAIACTSSG